MTGRVIHPGDGAARPSVLAAEPNNVALSIERRQKLVDGFARLPADQQADFIELAERALSTAAGFAARPWRYRLRSLLCEVWRRAGLDS